jgi:hypothetical protein
MHSETFYSEKYHAASGSPAIHDVVSIKNGKGFKLREIMGKNGKVVRKSRKTLTRKEKSHIMTGQFLPGLWANCLPCSRSKSQKRHRTHVY